MIRIIIKNSRNLKHDHDMAVQKYMTMTIFLIILLTIVCNIPYTVIVTISVYHYEKHKDIEAAGVFIDTLIFYTFSTLLPLLNSAFNPIILIFRGKVLRVFVMTKLVKVKKMLKRSPNNDDASASVMSTTIMLSSRR